MSGTGTVTIQWHRGNSQQIPNVPVAQYEKLDQEVKSGGGYYSFQFTAADGSMTTVTKREIQSVSFKPTTSGEPRTSGWGDMP